MRVRQSTMKIWNKCPLQARLNELHPEVTGKANSKTVFGTIIHYCLEQYHNGTPIETCVELFKEFWDEPERITVKPEVWARFTTYASLREKGIDILNLYHARNRWEHREIIASEHRFLVPFGDHELEGTVDFLEIKKDGRGKRTLRVSDLKTSSRKPTKWELQLDLQFTTYIYASLQPEFWLGNGPGFPGVNNGEKLFNDLQDVARRGVWFHLMTGQELDAGARDDDDFFRLYRLVNEIERARNADVFVPHVGDACTFCPHTEHCGIEIPSDSNELALEFT